MEKHAPAIEPDELLEFLYRLGQAYLAAGEQTAQVELILRRIATAYGMRKSRVVAFPTAVFVTFHDGEAERVTLSEGATQTLRLDQMADVYALGQEAQDATVTPRDGLQRLSEILRQEARFGAVGTVIGHTILGVGLAMVLMPTFVNLAAAAVISAIVGLAKLVNRDRAVLAVPAPVIVAALVSALVFVALKRGLPVDPVYVLIPPLVTFLPGAMLTLGMVELAYGDMVSGASRLITGFVQLILLTFGLAVGAVLVGFSPDDLVEYTATAVDLPLAQWAGVLVFGLGVYLHFSAPRNSLGWLLLVLLLAFAAQRVSTAVFSSEISGFFGTLVATPLAYLIHLGFRGPPATVTFLPAFWLLVPGSLGLLSVTTMLSDRTAGLAGLVTVIFALASTALGTLVGASLYKFLTEKFGWWRLQIGRVSSYVRRQGKR
jgi:uncharacterized membrane protein YjjP (DUF1212 family)